MVMDIDDILQWPCERLLERHPYAKDFFQSCGLPPVGKKQTAGELFNKLSPEQLEALGMDTAQLADKFLSFLEQMEHLRSLKPGGTRRVTVVGGRDKSGREENVRLTFEAGEVVAVVGPTGAGKSMLLSDIECMAQGDTPSGRRILIDDRVPDEGERLSGQHRLVAQLSQNMNFVMDLSVGDFLAMHAQSRLVEDIDGIVAQVLSTAVGLAGEPFDEHTQVTSLSGGQSRALMIADVACLSASPIVLIDEIENAGVDRRRALNLLVKKEKIVLMATHDPLLALSGDRRLVIRNGGIAAVIETSEDEHAVLGQLEAMDRRLASLRDQLREGKRIEKGRR